MLRIDTFGRLIAMSLVVMAAIYGFIYSLTYIPPVIEFIRGVYWWTFG